jgi:hypothetical protein
MVRRNALDSLVHAGLICGPKERTEAHGAGEIRSDRRSEISCQIGFLEPKQSVGNKLIRKTQRVLRWRV